ncbi:MAG TPA: cobalamin-binding protein, partial [Thermoplasmata archaeon]|nr:cobalamin-binding protein [Thermoplasmata archaeon]
MRVVSLLPSATEMVAELGHRTDLVGRSAECDFPPEVRSLPVVMRAKTLDSSAPSAEIDARVRESRGRGESLYWLDLDLLRSLRPELLLTQDLCGVCSVTEEEVGAACAAAGVSPRILSLTPRRLEDVIDSARSIGRALGAPEVGERYAQRLSREWAAHGPVPAHAPRVAVLEWLDPPILAGLWVPEIIGRAGARPWHAPEAGAPGQPCRWSDLTEDPPDAVILSPCSFSVDRTADELASPALEGLRDSLDGLRV